MVDREQHEDDKIQQCDGSGTLPTIICTGSTAWPNNIIISYLRPNCYVRLLRSSPSQYRNNIVQVLSEVEKFQILEVSRVKFLSVNFNKYLHFVFESIQVLSKSEKCKSNIESYYAKQWWSLRIVWTKSTTCSFVICIFFLIQALTGNGGLCSLQYLRHCHCPQSLSLFCMETRGS